MSVETAQSEPSVIVVVSAAAERCAQICRALGAAGVDVIRLPDVYLALGQIAADAVRPPMAVVVQAAALDSAEVEFFSLAKRLLPNGQVCVFSESDAEQNMLRNALAAGATKLDVTALTEWAEALADTLPTAPTDNPVESHAEPAAEAMEAVVNTPVPEPPPEPPDEPPAESPLEQAPSQAPSLTEDLHAVPDAPETEPAQSAPPAPADEAPAASAPPAPEAPPTADLRVARPIAVPHEWLPRPVLPRHNSDARPDDDSAIPAVPWRPPAGRPARTPPSARAAGPVPPDHAGADVEITREEIDALLNDAAEAPDPRRNDR